MDKFLLAPYFSCGFYKDELDLGFGSILMTIKDRSEQEVYLKAASFMKYPKTKDELKEFITNEAVACDADVIYQTFIDKNFLIKVNDFDSEERYSRDHLFYNLSGEDPKLVQQQLEKKHVIILGCGGIGNIIATNLAVSGVGKLTLIDSDDIELSNLTRQILFTEADVGNKKTTTLKEALLSRNHHVSVNTLDIICDDPKKFPLLPDCDLIVASGDSDNICFYLNQHSYREQIPFINVGYIQDIACWGPFIIPGKTACYECFAQSNIANQKNSLDDLVESINRNSRAASFGAINMLAAASATLDIIKYLGGFGEIQSLDKRIGIWTDHLKIECQNYQKNQNCNLCAR